MIYAKLISRTILNIQKRKLHSNIKYQSHFILYKGCIFIASKNHFWYPYICLCKIIFLKSICTTILASNATGGEGVSIELIHPFIIFLVALILINSWHLIVCKVAWIFSATDQILWCIRKHFVYVWGKICKYLDCNVILGILSPLITNMWYRNTSEKIRHH